MTGRMKAKGVRLRPHLKTAKSAKVAELALADNFGGITVSTIAEASYFAEAGFRDITYALGAVPAKLDALAPLLKDGVAVQLITDDAEAARRLNARAAELGLTLDLLIEIDSGLGRGGVRPESEAVVEIGRVIHGSEHLRLEGVLTHAGHSYRAGSVAEVKAVAEEERSGLVLAAERLRQAGLPCPTVSGGSTPTAMHAENLEGVTEMRPGNYMFFDLDQVGLKSCTVDDVAVSVLATVIGHNRRSGTLLIDAGALALSKDMSANAHLPDAGYGWVFERLGRQRIGDLRVDEVHQEHGFVKGALPFDALPIGSLVRVIPNHSCITCAMYDRYYVTEGGERITEVWPRINGW